MLYLLILLLYLLIGTFIYGVTSKATPNGMQDAPGFWIFVTVFAWPIFLCILVVMGVCLAILALGERVGEWINKFLESI